MYASRSRSLSISTRSIPSALVEVKKSVAALAGGTSLRRIASRHRHFAAPSSGDPDASGTRTGDGVRNGRFEEVNRPGFAGGSDPEEIAAMR